MVDPQEREAPRIVSHVRFGRASDTNAFREGNGEVKLIYKL